MWDCTRGARTYWTARTTTAIEEYVRAVRGARAIIHCAAVLAAMALVAAEAAGIRERMRPDAGRGTRVSPSQAEELTLTLVDVAPHELQTWVRTAARLEQGRHLRNRLCPPFARMIRAGQRVRVFPPDSKSSVYRGSVTRVSPSGACVNVEVRLAVPVEGVAAPYHVVEIVVHRGKYLSIPKEAIIEEGDRRLVYVQYHPGHYVPREIHTGLEGELYTEVREGLAEGDRVVTLGSFFIDAEYKTKAGRHGGGGHAHMHH